jgi:hypothetical protein
MVKLFWDGNTFAVSLFLQGVEVRLTLCDRPTFPSKHELHNILSSIILTLWSFGDPLPGSVYSVIFVEVFIVGPYLNDVPFRFMTTQTMDSRKSASHTRYTIKIEYMRNSQTLAFYRGLPSKRLSSKVPLSARSHTTRSTEGTSGTASCKFVVFINSYHASKHLCVVDRCMRPHLMVLIGRRSTSGGTTF